MDLLIIPIIILLLIFFMISWRIYLTRQSILICKDINQLTENWKRRRLILLEFIRQEYLGMEDRSKIWRLLNVKSADIPRLIRQEENLTQFLEGMLKPISLKIERITGEIKRSHDELRQKEERFNQQILNLSYLNRVFKIQPIAFFTRSEEPDQH